MFLLCAVPAAATTIFNCPSGFTTTAGEGNCGVNPGTGTNRDFWYGPNSLGSLVGTQLQLIPANGTGHEAAGFIYQTLVNVQAFTSTFTFIPNGQNLALTFNNSTNNPLFNTNIFNAGAGCEGAFYQGYSQTNPPNDVFAMMFDQVNPLTNGAAFTYSSIQIYRSDISVGGSLPPYVACPCINSVEGCGTNNSNTGDIPKLSTSPVPLNSPVNTWLTSTGDVYSATVTYDGSNFKLSFYDVTAGGSCPGASCYTNTWTSVNIPASVGANTAWVGFQGATRNVAPPYPLFINSWSYTTTPSTISGPRGTGKYGGGGIW